MVCNGKLSGIVSFGNGCAQPDYPGIYTRIEHYISWIESIVDHQSKLNYTKLRLYPLF